MLTAVGQANNIDTPIQGKQAIDPLRVVEPQPESKNLMLGLVLEFPIYSFYLGSPDIEGQAYVPNFLPRVGPQISWKGLGSRMTFALTMPSKEIERRGESDQANFLFNFYWKQFAINLYSQYFKGFYVASPFQELSEAKPSRYTQLPDAEATHFGINVYLKSDISKYGLDAAFDDKVSERFKGEGWILAPFYRWWKIDLGETIVKGSKADALDELPEVHAGTFHTLGITYGYSKTWIINEYFLSGLASAGPGLQLQAYEDESEEKSKVSLSGKLNLKAAAGRSFGEYLVGANVVTDTLYSRINGMDIYSTMASLEFYVNRNF